MTYGRNPTSGRLRKNLPVSGQVVSVERWLVRFGYDGAPFDGWARQPGRTTVEGTILRGWARGIAPGRPDLQVASRTDRGVSAVGNALCLRSELPASVVLRRLNGIHPSLFFTAATPIPDDFRVRAATRRTYEYFERVETPSLPLWRRGARALTGRIDVRSFGRGVPTGSPVWRDVEAISVRRGKEGFVVQLTARSFVWGMVRKIISALRQLDQGRLELERLKNAAAGRERLNLPLAEAEALLLREVQFDIPWTTHWDGPNRHQRAALARQQRALAVRTLVFAEFEDAFR